LFFRSRFATLLFALALLALGAPGQSAPGDTRSFVLLHSNDQHGHLLPFSYPDRISKQDDVAQMPLRKNIGGIARRATLVSQIRARGKNVFLFDAGDCMDGTPFSTEFLGKADYDAMNGVGYDYAVPGNHDFNMTAAQFEELVRLVKFPYLLANVYKKNSNETILPPYKVADWDGLKVAVFALTTYSSRTYKAVEEAFRMRDPVEVAREMVPRLRKQADLVVLVAHNGLDVDRQIAREVPGIDIIVGGHSHTRVPHGIYVLANNPGPQDPKGTIIVQAHQWVGELGRLDVTVTEGADSRWRVSRYAASLLPVTDRYADHPAVAKTVAGYWDQIKDKYAVQIGQATDDFSEVDGLDPTNYYLVADAVREASGAQFDLENFGGVRAPILKGPITLADLVTLDPFANTVYTFKIKGADLKKLLVATRPATSAGLRYELRREASPAGGSGTAPRGRWRLVRVTLNGKPIEDDTLYAGAANSYYFSRSVKSYAVDAVDTGRKRLDVVVDYIRKNSPITPRSDGRVNLNGGNPYD
jgi:5'-nucleotidase